MVFFRIFYLIWTRYGRQIRKHGHKYRVGTIADAGRWILCVLRDGNSVTLIYITIAYSATYLAQEIFDSSRRAEADKTAVDTAVRLHRVPRIGYSYHIYYLMWHN